MLKKEDILKTLGITEEQVKELNINVDALINETQKIGDGIASKYTSQIEELKNKKKDTPPAENKTNQTFTLEDVAKLVNEAVNGVKSELGNTKNIETFTNKATELGYSKEQIEGIIATSDVAKLNDFNFDLFPKIDEADLGSKKQSQNDVTLEEEVMKSLGL